MQALSNAYLWLLNALKVLGGIIIFMIFVLIVVDVTLTTLRIPPWAGTIGLVEYGLLWFTMLGAPWLARIKGHVYIDAVTIMLPPGIQRVVAIFAYIVVVAGALLSGYYSTILFWDAFTSGQIDERGVELMQWWLYAPMPFGFFLVAVEFLRYLLGFDDLYAKRTDVKDSV